MKRWGVEMCVWEYRTLKIIDLRIAIVGWYFGFNRGLLLVSFASTSGATVAFLLSRYLLREAIQNKFGDRLASFNDSLQREGAFYLFTLRLIPVVPFFVINVVMGLTPLKPAAFVVLGLFPLAIKKIMARFRPQPSSPETTANNDKKKVIP